jgi:hypothetical protein
MMEDITAELQARIRARLRAELAPIADRIIDEECAATALNISRWISVQYLAETIRIEIKRTDGDGAKAREGR